MPELKKSYEERLAAWEKARFLPAPEPDLKPVEPSVIEFVPMRDGVKLYTEIFLPKDDEEYRQKNWPIILLRSPYPYSRMSRAGGETVPKFLEAGYAVVFQLTRGQGKSEGTFHLYVDELDDGYDCIAWIEKQAWCNGRVGMQGPSYLGTTQMLAAKAKPPVLKCIIPAAFIGNACHAFPFSYGVPWKPTMQWYQFADAERLDDTDVSYGDTDAVMKHPGWKKAFHHAPLLDAADEVLQGDKLEAYRENHLNPMDGAYWKKCHFTDSELDALDIPILFTDGWYDMTMGPINFFSRMDQMSIKPDRYLLVGPWNHGQTFSKHEPGVSDGDRVLPDNGAVDLHAVRMAFFDRYLKGEEKQTVQPDRVRVYISGDKDSNANVWKNYPTFPAPDTAFKKLFLHSQGGAHNNPSDGSLDDTQPDNEPTDHYIYDPRIVPDSPLGSSQDRRQIEIRNDVLTYTTAPLDKPMTILGDITLVLYAASDCPDTDWLAVVTEVMPDGQSKSFHYSHHAFRARYRKGFDKEVFLTANKPEEFRIPMGPAGHQVAAGNALRLSIFSGSFPNYEPNRNTGNPVATDTEIRVAMQSIYHDAQRASHLILPLIELDE